MSNIIHLDFKKVAVPVTPPNMRWSKDEIDELYEDEIDPQQYNIQCHYDYAIWVSSPFNGEDSLCE